MIARSSPASNRAHRGESVVKDVLLATLEELAKVGYRALRIENVATRAKVNKTTVYRRWPTKVELVHDTIRSMFATDHPEPDTGTLRGDLLVVARQMFEFLCSANGQVLVRMMMSEGADDDLQGIVDALRIEKESSANHIFARAKARGEVRHSVGSELMMSSLMGGLHHRIFAMCSSTNAIDIEEHVDLLLYGAVPRPSSTT